MPRLQIPEIKPSQDSPLNAGAAAGAASSGAKLGQLQATAGAEAVANRAKLGEIQSTQGAQAMADAGAVGKIMQGAGAAAAAEYANTGKAAMHVGQEVMAQGNEYFQKAMGAIDDAMYNNAYADASKEFNQRISERIAKPYDDNGQPNFSRLQADIDGISADVYSKYSRNLGSPEAYNRFSQSFTTLSTNQSIMAMNEARKQQIDYSQGSLVNGLNAATTNALSGPKEMLPQYLSEGNSQIDNAVKNGYITMEEGVRQKESLRKNINVGWLEIQNQKDPVATRNMINGSKDGDLGINAMERSKLLESNNRQLKALQEANDKRAKEEKAVQNEVYNRNYLDIRLGIDKGTINENQINDAYTKGDITQKQMVDLQEKRMKASGETAQKTAQRTEVGAAVKQGDVLTGKFSDAQINDHYSYSQALQGGNVPLFDPNAPIDKARLASGYKAPVTAFTDEISGTIMAGNPDQVVKAINAYNIVQSKNPLAVSKLDAKSLAMVEIISSRMKYTNSDVGAIVADAKKAVLETNKTIEEQRRQQFDNVDEFKSAKIDTTIKGMYEENHWFSKDVSLPEYALPILKTLLQQNYMLTGDADVAKEMTKKQTAGIIGKTTINGNPSTMFMPPEYAYPQFDFQVDGKSAMRTNMEQDVQPILKKGEWADNSYLTSDNIEVRSYYGTSRQLGDVNYMLYNKATGEPIINPDTGQPVTWHPDADYIMGLKSQDIEKKRAQELKLEQEGGFGKGYYTPANPNIGKTSMSEPNTATQAGVIKTALGFLGYNEKSHRDVLESFMSRSLNQSLDPSKTPWCAGFVNGVLAANGVKGSGSNAARSLLNVGTPTNDPRSGDIVVLSRGNDPTKGHVGFYVGRDKDGRVLILGGNQGANGSVSIEAFDENRVIGYRRPPSADEIQQKMTSEPNMFNYEQAPTAKSAEAATPQPMGGGQIQLASNDSNFSIGGNMPSNKALPIGIRQNNPGNLAKNGVRWDGELPNSSSRFKEFATPEDGIAGIMRSLRTKQEKRGTTTPQELIYGKKVNGKFIGAYSETDQAEYVAHLSKELGIGPNDKYDLNDPKQALKLVRAIIKMENGYVPYPDSTIMTGIMRAK